MKREIRLVPEEPLTIAQRFNFNAASSAQSVESRRDGRKIERDQTEITDFDHESTQRGRAATKSTKTSNAETQRSAEVRRGEITERVKAATKEDRRWRMKDGKPGFCTRTRNLRSLSKVLWIVVQGPRRRTNPKAVRLRSASTRREILNPKEIRNPKTEFNAKARSCGGAKE
jgi:hypothetical protein